MAAGRDRARRSLVALSPRLRSKRNESPARRSSSAAASADWRARPCWASTATTVTAAGEEPVWLGGRANYFEADGFRFDMGPSWYLMPDVFEHFFALLGERVEDHLPADPPRPVVPHRRSGAPTGPSTCSPTSTGTSPPSSGWSRAAVRRCATTWSGRRRSTGSPSTSSCTATTNGCSTSSTARPPCRAGSCTCSRTCTTTSADRSPPTAVQKILEYQLVFLGSSPYNTPALYNIMSHIDFNLGVFYPAGRDLLDRPGAGEHRRAGTGCSTGPRRRWRQILTEGGRATGVRLGVGRGAPGRPDRSPTPTCTTPRPRCCRRRPAATRSVPGSARPSRRAPSSCTSG